MEKTKEQNSENKKPKKSFWDITWSVENKKSYFNLAAIGVTAISLALMACYLPPALEKSNDCIVERKINYSGVLDSSGTITDYRFKPTGTGQFFDECKEIQEKIQKTKNDFRKYNESQKQIKGVVLEAVLKDKIPNSSFFNDLEKMDTRVNSSYQLKVKKDDGKIISLNVLYCANSNYFMHDLCYFSYPQSITKENFEGKIKKGSRISFPSGNILRQNTLFGDIQFMELEDETYFNSSTTLGSKYIQRINVLN